MQPYVIAAALAIAASAAASPQQRANPADSTKRVAPAAGDLQQLKDQVTRLRGASDSLVPPADRFSFGDRAISAGTAVQGPIAIARGNLDVSGTVDGDAFVIGGDIRVHTGGRVTGDALAAGGRVIIDGGVVEGEMRSLTATHGGTKRAAVKAPLATWQAIKLVVGWFALLMIIGLGVMIFAEGNLDGVVIALERGFARSFWIGVAGQLVMLPVLLLLCVALTITIVGILLVPFAIVCYVIAAAGLVAIGFLGVARLTGGALTPDSGTTSPRGVHLRALFLGLTTYSGLWLLAAAFAWSPLVGSMLRVIAIAVTWVAATVGLGAALASRAGTQRPGVTALAERVTGDEFAWQTPTPVSGVAASRRPASPSTTS